MFEFTSASRYWEPKESGVICAACPRRCFLHKDQRGACYVRKERNNQIVLTSYGRSSGFCIDPIEKKPLNHFYPGSSVLSFGTAGCNLSCKFCQNWDISKATSQDKLNSAAYPENIARTAAKHNCQSVAFTYNDPVIFNEYAVDTAQACREFGIQSVAVSAGYVDGLARETLFNEIDAANIDLKAFSDEFYFKVCGGHLDPVLQTLKYIHHETDCWLEITTLLIPGLNDSKKEITDLCHWVLEHLADWVPIHFSAFHPDFKMRDIHPTPADTLLTAREIALQRGLKHIYLGPVNTNCFTLPSAIF